MQLVGRGDEHVRATHDKTLELVAGAAITERATCVIAVGTAPLAHRVAGPVRVTIAAGSERFAFDAEANSGWDPAGGSAVIRRGPLRLPGTVATHATAAAADLPRALVERLQDPATTVTVTLEPRRSAPRLVIVVVDPAGPPDPRLPAERAAADTVYDGAATPGPLVGRTLVVTSEPAALAPVDVPVETVGAAPDLAAALAAPWGGPIVLAPDHDAELLRRIPAATRLVLRTDRRGLPRLLAQAGAVRGSTRAVVAREFADPVVVAVGDPGEFPGAERLWVCPEPGPDDLDPAVAATIDALLADGVATRTAARALATLAGWPQRRAYDAVLRRRGS